MPNRNKAETPRTCIVIDDVLDVGERNGVCWIDIETDGSVVRLKMGAPTLLKGMGRARAHFAGGAVIRMSPRPEHS